jgi:N-acetylglucosamine-6-phosphate deacetylase
MTIRERVSPHVSLFRALSILGSAGALFMATLAVAQEAPPVGMRPVDVRRDAIVNVTLVPTPGERLADAVVVMKDGWIERVGARGSFEIPAGTRVHDGAGATVYAGFIDACVRLDSAAAARAAGAEAGSHWNLKVTPQVRAADLAPIATDARKSLRSQGFAMAALHPDSGIFRGSSQVVLLGDDPRAARTVRADAGTSIAFETTAGRGGDDDPEAWNRATYPGALIGSIALVRQTLADANWHAACAEAWSRNPSGNEPPQLANALDALVPAVKGTRRAWFDASDDRNLMRADSIAREFSLDAGFIGSGREYRALAQVKATGRPVVVPFDFPRAPDATTPRAIEAVPLRELAHWALAPTNLAELLRAGVPAAASTVRLKDAGSFAKAARRAMDAGTTEDEMLAALTVHPARMLGVQEIAGEVKAGRMANLVVCDGPLFGEESKVRETWIAGLRHEVEPRSRFPMKGTYALRLLEGSTTEPGKVATSVVIDADERTIAFLMAPPRKPEEAPDPNFKPEPVPPAAADAAKSPKAKPEELRAEGVNFEDSRAGFTVSGSVAGVEAPLRGMVVATKDGAEVTVTKPDGGRQVWAITPADRTGDAPRADRRQARAEEGGPEAGAKEGDAAKSGDAKNGDQKKAPRKVDVPAVLASIPRTFPLADYGIEKPFAPGLVLVEHATVWTAAKDGILEDADVLVRDGKVAAVGRGLRAGIAGADLGRLHVIDGRGKHVTPGLIDCHSHTGIDGGVNEWTQNVTAEVRIADAVNAEDVDWYRQLAGGLVAANQLHGSANPIGGQNSVVKIRWGEPAAAFPVKGAIPGIKFALGENVTRSKKRYPSSRLGVETLIRDRFQSAREWREANERWAALPEAERARTMRPRPDLELEALAEILEGKRLVHCHSYRQDEIAMLLRIADDFGFKVGTLQHVLEGYKVADDIARHGAGASSFSDWWAYKVEVMDAIPWNGQMLWRAGVLTSFNSDSDELARRMNTEAAKAVKYGAMPREEAIKFVTINPARQLRIDSMTGSLEPGKDADFVVWSGDPLSVYSRCLQTWVDGVRRFDADEDRAMRARDAATRAKLVELAMGDWGKDRGGESAGGARGRRGRGADPGSPPGGAPPTDSLRAGARGSLLVRMLGTRDDYLLEQVRSGIDPESVRPGECGCDRMDSWSAIFETTGGEGGAR